METKQWLNRSLPQYLYGATLLLYMNAAIGALFEGWLANPFGWLLLAGHVGAGYGISNERKWGWQLGVAMAFAPMAFRFIFLGLGHILSVGIIGLLFEVVLIVLLLHDESRQHQRIWFS